MTDAERAVIVRDPRSAGRSLHWSLEPGPWTPGAKVALAAQPCPFVTDRNACAIYDIRPYNCRRFGCFRPEPAREPLDLTADGVVLNFVDRFQASRRVRQEAERLQARAQPWALAHGWTP